MTDRLANPLTTQQIERALGFFKTGKFDDRIKPLGANIEAAGEQPDDPEDKKAKRAQFNEILWGDNTRAWSRKAAAMSSELWEAVLLESLAMVGNVNEDEEMLADAGEPVNPRDLIIVS